MTENKEGSLPTEAEERCRSIFQHSPTGMYFYHLSTDGQLILTDANPAADRILRIDHRPLIGKTIETAFPNLGQTRIPQMYRQVAQGDLDTQSFEITYQDERVNGIYAVTVFQTGLNQIAVEFENISDRKHSENIIRENEERYRLLADNITDFIYTMNLNFEFTYASPSSISLLGYTPEEIKAIKLAEIMTPKSLALAVGTIQEELSQEAAGKQDLQRARALEFELIRKNGSTVWVESKASFLRNAENRPIGIIGVSRDISERKQAEDALSRERFFSHALLENMEAGVVACDAEGKLILFNRTAREWHGMDAMSIPQKDWARYYSLYLEDGITPMSIDTVPLARAYRGETVRHECMVIAAEGKPKRLVMADGVPFFDKNGQLLGAVAVMHDITQHRYTEAAMTESETFLNNIIENIPNMIFVKDAQDLRFVRFNRAGEELIGYKREELLGKNDYDFFPREEADFFIRKDRQTLMNNELTLIPEEKIQTKSRGERILQTKKIPIRDIEGRPRFLLGISEDITDRKRMEAQLIQAQKMDAIGRLSGGIAHDFNNYLTAIRGFTDLLLADFSPDDPRYVYVQEIRDAANRSIKLVQQLLAFSRKQMITPKIVNLKEIVLNTAKLLERLLDENIQLKIQAAENTGNIRIDPTQLEQIILNLALNARDAMPKGGKLLIETSCTTVIPETSHEIQDLKPGNYVQLSVQDTGCGMSSEVRSHIFEPFFTTKAPGKGTGLGLATVYGIVNQNHGIIHVSTEEKKGSCFKILFPKIEDGSAPTKKEEDAIGLPRGTETLLVVEDTPSVQRLMHQILTSLGYGVIIASNGEEAIQKVKSVPNQTIHMLLTDVIMPQMSGKELEEQVRKLRLNIKVLFCSGYTDERLTPHGILDANIHFLQKPFTETALALKVRSILDEPQ